MTQAQEENVRLREAKERQAFDFKNAQNQNTTNLKADCERRASVLVIVKCVHSQLLYLIHYLINTIHDVISMLCISDLNNIMFFSHHHVSRFQTKVLQNWNTNLP